LSSWSEFKLQVQAKKSASNLSKHGMNLIDAQMLWDDPNLVELKAISGIVPRALIIGRISNQHWSAIICQASLILASSEI